MIKILRALLLLFPTIFIWGQRNDIIEIQDFNEDGVDDRLECLRELGVSCTFIDGSTKKGLEWGNFVWKGAIKSVITVPKTLLLKENEQIYKAMQIEVLPFFKKSADRSLQWIINASFSKQKRTGNPYLDLIFSPFVKWQSGKFKIPSNYYVEMSRDSLYQLDEYQQKDSLNNITTGDSGFLVYYGDVHFKNEEPHKKKFIQVAKDSVYIIYKTPHGVLAQKKNKFKWLFVTDYGLTGGPEKLRWESIEGVFQFDGHVLIKQSLAPDPTYQLYIVNIETGMTGRIKIDFDSLLAHDIEFLDLSTTERFSIKENVIEIGNEVKTLRFPIDEIKKDLDAIYKNE